MALNNKPHMMLMSASLILAIGSYVVSIYVGGVSFNVIRIVEGLVSIIITVKCIELYNVMSTEVLALVVYILITYILMISFSNLSNAPFFDLLSKILMIPIFSLSIALKVALVSKINRVTKKQGNRGTHIRS